jgi:hypothetical protein
MGSTADDSGVDGDSGSNVFGTSSVWPQAIRGYSGQDSPNSIGIFNLVYALIYRVKWKTL